MKLDDANLNAIITKSIVDSLTPESRAELIGGAVTKLLEPDSSQSGYYADRRTFLQKAFDAAVYQVAQKIAAEELASDAVIAAQVKALFEEAWLRATSGDKREALVAKMAAGIESALSGRDR